MYRIDELEADVMKKGTSDTPYEAAGSPVSPDQQRADAGRTDGAVAERLREVEVREKEASEQQAKDQEARGREAQEKEALRVKVGSHELLANCLHCIQKLTCTICIVHVCGACTRHASPQADLSSMVS